MEFSMNGFRRHLSNDTKALRDIVSSVVNGDFYETEDLIDAMNDVVTHSNVVNCVFIKEDSSFTDMSDLEIDHIEPITDKEG